MWKAISVDAGLVKIRIDGVRVANRVFLADTDMGVVGLIAEDGTEAIIWGAVEILLPPSPAAA